MREIADQVHDFLWNHDMNCAQATLQVLSEKYSLNLSSQLLAAAMGLNGAGRSGAQCGLVEGALIFLGVFSETRGWDRYRVSDLCGLYAREFIGNFGSMNCRDLRPQGFQDGQPPHMCEDLAVKTITFSCVFIDRFFKKRSEDDLSG